MSRKLLIVPLAAILATSAMLVPAMAQKPGAPKTNTTTVNASKSNTFKVKAVNASAGTFTAATKDGKEFTFTILKGSPPVVGKVYEITYTENPGGGPLISKNLNSSRSNFD